MKIIGFTGLKGSGKSEAANALRRWSMQINFADALKEMFAGLTTYHALYGPSGVRDRVKLRGTDITVRRGLQHIGIAMRELDEDFWVKAWRSKIDEIKASTPLNPSVYKYWVAADVRFSNEARAIHEMGGAIIRISRDSVVPDDRHISESGLLDSEVDIAIHNNRTIEALHKEVLKKVRHNE